MLGLDNLRRGRGGELVRDDLIGIGNWLRRLLSWSDWDRLPLFLRALLGKGLVCGALRVAFHGGLVSWRRNHVAMRRVACRMHVAWRRHVTTVGHVAVEDPRLGCNSAVERLRSPWAAWWQIVSSCGLRHRPSRGGLIVRLVTGV